MRHLKWNSYLFCSWETELYSILKRDTFMSRAKWVKIIWTRGENLIKLTYVQHKATTKVMCTLRLDLLVWICAHITVSTITITKHILWYKNLVLCASITGSVPGRCFYVNYFRELPWNPHGIHTLTHFKKHRKSFVQKIDLELCAYIAVSFREVGKIKAFLINCLGYFCLGIQLLWGYFKASSVK